MPKLEKAQDRALENDPLPPLVNAQRIMKILANSSFDNRLITAHSKLTIQNGPTSLSISGSPEHSCCIQLLSNCCFPAPFCSTRSVHM